MTMPKMNNGTKLRIAIIAVILIFSITVIMGAAIKRHKTAEELRHTFINDEVSVDFSNCDSEMSSLMQEHGIPVFYICDSSELTGEMLENREGDILVERCIGKVVNAESGDGEVLNYADKDYRYISYRNIEGTEDGDMYVSYFVYNPFGCDVDDIIERFDFKV